MVLSRIAFVLVLAGCHQSLFDSHGDDTTGDGHGGGDGMIASSCPMPCLGDAGGDFKGGGHATWRYLDDHRDRTWAAMAMMGSAYVGADAANKIASCEGSSAEACGALPGALLFSTSGMASPADPAIEYTAPMSRIIQLQLGIHVPNGGASQTVRLYRNSREDVLYSATADAGVTLSQMITLDALAGDRFLVAISPPGAGAQDIGVQAFIVGDPASFPQTCQLAVPFASAVGNTVMNACGAGVFTSQLYNNSGPDMPTPPTLVAGPFAEQGMAASFPMDHYYDFPNALARGGDTTVQLWVKHNGVIDSATEGYAFSDMDLDNKGGMTIGIFISSVTSILTFSVVTCTETTPQLVVDGPYAPYPNDHAWHFIRAVHSGDDLQLCLDGVRVAHASFPGNLQSTYAPYLGKNVVWTPSEPGFLGTIDDVRVFSTALPCN